MQFALYTERPASINSSGESSAGDTLCVGVGVGVGPEGASGVGVGRVTGFPLPAEPGDGVGGSSEHPIQNAEPTIRTHQNLLCRSTTGISPGIRLTLCGQQYIRGPRGRHISHCWIEDNAQSR